MKPVRIVSAGGAERALLDAVASAVSGEFRVPCNVSSTVLDVGFAHHPERNQYHSTRILERLTSNGETVLAVTDLDLYIPILTFVFGEAQLGGTCAIVSYHRLAQEFYGLPADAPLRKARLIKEAIHELGHTAALTHCDDYECVMAASHAVEWLDLKGAAFCSDCRAQLR
jgi:archaemetzincin